MAHDLIPKDALTIYVILSLFLPIFFIVANLILSPRNPGRKKRLSYETANEPLEEYRPNPLPWEYFPYALIYIAYAVLALVVFITVISLASFPDFWLKSVIFLAILSVASVFMSAQLPKLIQKA